MSKVITLSRKFPSYHPKAGQPTYFVESIMNSIYPGDQGFDFHYEDFLKSLNSGRSIAALNVFRSALEEGITNCKHHTIRAGKRWKTGDKASLRVWSGKPYNSKQIIIAPDVELGVKDVEIWETGNILIDGEFLKISNYEKFARNDGLSECDMNNWFSKSLPFSGQILIWNNQNLPY